MSINPTVSISHGADPLGAARQEIVKLLNVVDDAAPDEMTGVFYAEAYWNLREVVEQALRSTGDRSTD